MSHRHTTCGAALALVAFFYAMPAICLAGETVDLRPKLEPGSTYYMEMVRDNEQTRGEGPFGPARTSKSQQIRGFMRKIESRSPDGGARAVFTYDRAKMEQESFRGPVGFDTDKDPGGETPNPMANIGRPMMGKSFTLYLDKTGHVTSVTGMEEIYEAIEELAAGAFIFEGMQDEFTAEAVSFVLGDDRMALYPLKTVSTGDTWTKTVRFENMYMGSLDFKYKCSLVSVSEVGGRKVAEVAYKGSITQPDDAKPGIRVFNMKMDFESGSFTGTATFDVQRGHFTKQVTNSEMATNASMVLGSIDKPMAFKQSYKVAETIRFMSPAARAKQKAENEKLGVTERAEAEKAAAEAKAKAEAEKAEAEAKAKPDAPSEGE